MCGSTCSPRTIPRLLLVVAGIGSALLFGCSSAGRLAIPARHEPAGAVEPERQRPPLDLARPFRPFKAERPDQAGRLESSKTGPLTGRGEPVERQAASLVAMKQTGRLSPDGKWIAFEADRAGVRGVWVARPDGDDMRLLSGNRSARLPRWSPDGAHLMFLAQVCGRVPCTGRAVIGPDRWEIWIGEPGGSRMPRKVTSAVVSSAGAAWFPDSRRICYGSGNSLTVLDAMSGSTRTFGLPNEASRIVGVPAVSPDGERVVFAVTGQGAWVASIGDGEIWQLVSEPDDVDAFAWAPGGRQIAFRDAHDGQWKVQTLK